MENIEARVARVYGEMRALKKYQAQVDAAKASGVLFDACYHWGNYARVRIMKRPARPKSKRPLCGARCRSGAACKARVCERPDGKGLAKRCALHGGKSTGPKTEAGRAAIAAANRARSKTGQKSPYCERLLRAATGNEKRRRIERETG
jgi:hypothetical protein